MTCTVLTPSQVLNVETTALATLTKLVEDVKATYGNADKYVQGALAFLTSPYGERCQVPGLHARL